MTSFVDIHDLHFVRDNRIIFDKVNASIPQGKVTTIMGPSGTGKTTLLGLISGQLQPTRGRIVVGRQVVDSLSRSALYRLRKRMGMLFQTGGLFTHLSVFENVAFPLREHTKLSEAMIRHLVLLKLQMVGLRGARDLMPGQLSGGMARRVALARAIALDPELIMYDEPFSGQDPISMGVLLKLIRTINDTLGLTSIIVSHDVSETLSISDQAYVISNGAVIGEGTPQGLRNNKAQNLQQFLQGLPDGPVPFHFPAQTMKEDFLQEEMGC